MNSRLGFSFTLLLFLTITIVHTNYAQRIAIYKYGIYNSSGKQILPFEFDAVQLSDDSSSLILKKQEQLFKVSADGQLTQIDQDTNTKSFTRFQEITPPHKKYDLALKYANGFIKVRNAKSKKGGFLNAEGKEIVKCKFDWFYLDLLKNGLIKAKEGNSYHLFSLEGKELGIYDDIGSSFNNNRLLVVKEDLFGFVDNTGKIVLPIIYQRARNFSNNLAFVTLQDTAHYINVNGELSIPLPVSTHDGQEFQNDVVVVKDKNNNYSLIDSKGSILFTQHFSHLDNFQNGLSAAKETFEGDAWGVINKQGNIIIPFKFHETKVYNLKGNSFIAIRKAQDQEAVINEDNNKKPIATAKAYCYTAILKTPEVNALGATQLHTQALFIEIYAPYNMSPQLVKKRGLEFAMQEYPKGKVSQEIFTEVDNCDEIRARLSSQIQADQIRNMEKHLEK